MNFEINNILFTSFLEAIPALIQGFMPLILQILIPGIIGAFLLKGKDGYTTGAILGIFGAFTFGPFSSNPIFL